MRKLSSLVLQGLLARSKFNPSYGSVRLYCNKNDSDIPSFSKCPGPLAQYKNLVEQGKLKHDPYQEEVACKLDNLLFKLEQYERDMKEYHEKLNKWEQTRENERRGLLMAEAEVKQQGGSLEPGVKKQNAVCCLSTAALRCPDVVPPVPAPACPCTVLPSTVVVSAYPKF